MRLLFAGTPEAAVPSLRALLASDHDVVAVLTRADSRVGRGRTLTPSPVRIAAEEAGIEVITDPPRTPSFVDRLLALDLDACPVVAYGHLLKPEVLAIPRLGWINLHFSLLPAWRGAAPVQRALMAGDDVTGATTFVLDEGMDTGPVLGLMTESVRPRDTSGDLLDRLSRAGASLLVASLDGLATGALTPQPQTDDGASLAPKITTDDARLDWTQPALTIDRTARAVTPAPGAWTTRPTPRGEERLGLAPVVPTATEGLAPGQVQVTPTHVLVGTATTAVSLTDVKPPGKRSMPALDWARGARLTDAEVWA